MVTITQFTPCSSSSHAFVSLFKKQYDMLPKEYRKEQKSNKENSPQQIEQHNYIAGLKKYLINDISSNVTTPTADRIIDFSVSGSTIHLINTWKKMMTVGRASDVLISDVQQMLTQLQLAVGFEYIKLCGVFSDDLHVYTESDTSFKATVLPNFLFMFSTFKIGSLIFITSSIRYICRFLSCQISRR
jgi:hypothetical protein